MVAVHSLPGGLLLLQVIVSEIPVLSMCVDELCTMCGVWCVAYGVCEVYEVCEACEMCEVWCVRYEVCEVCEVCGV